MKNERGNEPTKILSCHQLDCQGACMTGEQHLANVSEHTPGPWNAYFVLGTEPKGPIDPTRVQNEWRIDPPKGTNGVSIVASVHGPDMAANARLIAAAPELLEVLKSLRHELALVGGMPKPIEESFIKAGEVIAKAEGR